MLKKLASGESGGTQSLNEATQSQVGHTSPSRAIHPQSEAAHPPNEGIMDVQGKPIAEAEKHKRGHSSAGGRRKKAPSPPPGKTRATINYTIGKMVFDVAPVYSPTPAKNIYDILLSLIIRESEKGE